MTACRMPLTILQRYAPTRRRAAKARGHAWRALCRVSGPSSASSSHRRMRSMWSAMGRALHQRLLQTVRAGMIWRELLISLASGPTPAEEGQRA